MKGTPQVTGSGAVVRSTLSRDGPSGGKGQSPLPSLKKGQGYALDPLWLAAPDPIPDYGDRRRMRVGIMGGSFNPAHQGHLNMAQTALRNLRLDQVWLLVSPGNPLKPAAGMAPLADRLACARAICKGPRMVASAIEAVWGTRYSIDTMRKLKLHFPRVQFVLLLGADNFIQLPRWRDWVRLAHTMPMAIMPRPGYNYQALAGKAAKRLRGARVCGHHVPDCVAGPAPAWVFSLARQDISSATALRAALFGEAPSPASPRPRPAAHVAPEKHPIKP